MCYDYFVQKGFSPVFILVGIITIIAIAGGAYYFGKSQVKPSVSQSTTAVPTPKTNSLPSQAPQPANLESLTTAVKGGSYTENTTVPNQKKYISPKLSISFLYLTLTNGQKIEVKEVGQKIYVYPTQTAYQDGQWVEVFNKSKTDTLAEAIKKQFLNEISEKDCFVIINKDSFKSYPESYSVAEISYPKSNDPESDPWGMSAVCPQGYSQTNGIRYFLGDSQHPGKLLFLSIGQYGIEAGEGNKLWQDTIQF